jgi:hypothetical protein
MTPTVASGSWSVELLALAISLPEDKPQYQLTLGSELFYDRRLVTVLHFTHFSPQQHFCHKISHFSVTTTAAKWEIVKTSFKKHSKCVIFSVIIQHNVIFLPQNITARKSNNPVKWHEWTVLGKIIHCAAADLSSFKKDRPVINREKCWLILVNFPWLVKLVKKTCPNGTKSLPTRRYM